MKRFRLSAVWRWCFTALLGLSALAAIAQDAVALGSRAHTLPVTVVDGHPVVAIKLTNGEGLVDAITVELAFDHPGTLILDGDQLGWLGVSPRSPGARVTFEDNVNVLFPPASIAGETVASRPALHNGITRLHASALKDRKLKGRLGLGFLRNYHVVLDLSTKVLELTPLSSAPPLAAIVSDYGARFDLNDGVIALPVDLPGGRSRLHIGSSAFDTQIDPAVAEKLGRPDGDVAPVTLPGASPLELSQYVIFRPQDWREKKEQAPGVALRTGTNFLEFFRVEIHWGASQLFLSALKQPALDVSDRDYFAAERADTPEAYLAFLVKHPDNRLAGDAARKLMRLRMEEWGVSDDDLIEALEWVAKTTAPDRRMEACAQHVRTLARQLGKTEVTIRAAKLALTHSRGAITVQDTYRLHRILGEQYLDLNDLDNAWRHLMSAGFVKIDRDPEHAFYVAYDLARVYEKQGRASRAYSRYRAALAVGFPIPKEMKEAIEKSIATLKAQIPAADLQLLEG